MSTASRDPIEEAGLRYVSDSMAGISRHKSGDSFTYKDAKGRPISDPRTLDRIRHLAIPPAYTNVWICPLANGHLQATGLDARRRKQYRYHPDFRALRDEAKFSRMEEFGQALPKIREAVFRDLAKPRLPRERVLACIVYLLEKSLIRVGNEEYASKNKSFGLTTLRNRHVQVEGYKIKFKFLGKSKIRHEIEIHDRRLTRITKRLQELPGQELFQFLDHDGNPHHLGSSDVNAYLKEISGADFTAKDFRTWAGTVLALTHLSEIEALPESQRGKKLAITSAITSVSKQLGNTPAICRKCYVHPRILEAFQEGRLPKLLAEAEAAEEVSEFVECAETAVLSLLKEAELTKAA